MALPSLEEVRERRKRLGISQIDLAKQCRVSRSLVAKLELGNLNPSYSMAEKIFGTLHSLEAERNKSSLTGTTLRQVHSTSITYAEAEERVADVWMRMMETGFSQLPVRREGRIVGSITERDINKALMEKDTGVKELQIIYIMGPPFPILSVDTPISAVVPLLLHSQAILTMEGEKVMGIVTNADVGKVFNPSITAQ